MPEHLHFCNHLLSLYQVPLYLWTSWRYININLVLLLSAQMPRRQLDTTQVSLGIYTHLYLYL